MSTLEYYDLNARAFVKGSINADMREHYARFLQYLSPESAILDLGCGSGRDSAFFIEKGFRVVPLDGSKEICVLAEQFLGIPVRCITFDQLDYSETFDAVWACASLLHVSKAELPNIAEKVYQALKPHGILYASFKYGEEEIIRDGRLFSNFTEHSINQVFSHLQWKTRELWVSSDVRPGRETESWINLIAEKLI